jgi:hypothetical protein
MPVVQRTLKTNQTVRPSVSSASTLDNALDVQPRHPTLAPRKRKGPPSKTGLWTARIIGGGLMMSGASGLKELATFLYDHLFDFRFSLTISSLIICVLIFLFGLSANKD